MRAKANPRRYGFLIPIFENVFFKKRKEADPAQDVAASEAASQVYSLWNSRLKKWKFQVIPVWETDLNGILRMPAISAKRFKSLSSAEKAEVSEELIRSHSPDFLGTQTTFTDRVIIDPDIHSGNFLFDPKTKTIFVFDKAQMVSIKQQDIESFVDYLAKIMFLRTAEGINEISDPRLQQVLEALRTMTGTREQDGFDEAILDYLRTTKETTLTGDVIVKDALNLQRLAGNYGLYLPDTFQDWLNEAQNLLWYQRHATKAHFTDALSEAVMGRATALAMGAPSKTNKLSDCGDVFSILDSFKPKVTED